MPQASAPGRRGGAEGKAPAGVPVDARCGSRRDAQTGVGNQPPAATFLLRHTFPLRHAFMVKVAILALGQAAAPGLAQAQCNPAPPPAPANMTGYASQSFGNTLPLVPFPNVLSIGNGGCGGINAGDDQNGTNGGAGQSGGAVTSINSLLIIIGAPTNPFFAPTIGATLGSAGGTGGVGGAAGNAYLGFTTAGDGGAGGNGGPVIAGFGGTFLADPASGLASFPLVVFAAGGQGGAGGGTGDQGGYAKLGGNGAVGGGGGSVSLTASGTIAGSLRGISVLADGGNAGSGGQANSLGDLLSQATGGVGGTGGSGGSAALQFTAGTINSTQFGVVATAGGGGGGYGGQAINAAGLLGGQAGAGGAGGTAGVTLSGGSVTVNQPASALFAGAGILVQANGAGGGAGGFAGATLGSGGGTGGAGGQGGTASASILGSVTYHGSGITGQIDGLGILIQANGGRGGAGGGASGFEGQSGSGGIAGAGGSAGLTLGSATNRGSIITSGNFAHGALVQSVGGGGGDGGGASFVFGGGSGGGAAGGDGGIVTVTAPNASIFTDSRSGAALIAQSIGGGGGSAGDIIAVGAGATLVIGGTGGLGGDGNGVNLTLLPGVFSSVSRLGGAGILAQSIGGSGGVGGSASASGVGLISLAIGGNAGSGGTGGTVMINSRALITTYGDHAAGIQAQSIGGGGGKGGAAVTFAAGLLPVAAVSIGGSGGGGGSGGQVGVTNAAQVTTYGADAHGVLIQSIGGGGGSGGAAAARAVDVSPSRQIPAISVAIATGGVGGVGNIGNIVSLTNSGLITTAGDGSIGVMAQSIGGGGGTGGDSTAASFTGGRTSGGLAVSITVAVGGAGGTGGRGGAVSLANSGVITTYGQDAFGVFAQSVGGGGGTGGGGDATSTATEAKFSFSTSLALGGRGGLGGDGGGVGLNNSGAIVTSGDGAAGTFAQSVGGGGGTGGGGTASAAGGNLAIAVGVGGSGGAGGNGNTVALVNSGSVLTRGTDAIAIFAQSVGGGGGSGGKAGATAGGVSNISNAAALNDLLLNGLNIGVPHTVLTDGIVQIGEIGENIQATIDQLRGILSQPQAGAAESGTSVQINVAVSVGGTGGAAGSGGAVSITNTGLVETYGAQSDGIYAQSVGGGGGSGGGATSTSGASDDTPAQTAIGVGGVGGGGGAGGNVTVVNGTGGNIVTQGVAAFGIFAHSVGGGGGEGAAAGTVSGSFKSLSVSVGGNGGGGGDGGAVSVTASTGGAITTTGKHGIAVVAQSVGGGGGLVRTMTTDQTFDPSKIVINPQGRIGDLHGLNLVLGGQNGIGGNGGLVEVTVAGPITTSGLGAHGVLAQSVGGGGGLVVGGRVMGPSINPVPPTATPTGSGTGNGGAVTVRLQAGTVIATAGHGAYGVIAQSIGGGGGIAGDLSGLAVSAGQSPTFFGYDYVNQNGVLRQGVGDGGGVSVTANGAQVHTTGNYAPAIFAQSVGGGGGLVGWIATVSGQQAAALSEGSAGGSGAGGAVTVSVVNSSIFADGVGSAGILAQSAGTSSGSIQISIDQASKVRGGTPDPAFSFQMPSERDAAAIRLLGGTANQITNAGQITGLGGGVAILADTTQGNTTVINTGTITGDIDLGGTGSVIDNRAGGIIDAPRRLGLSGGTLTNAGTLQVGGGDRIGVTTLTGNLVQRATGTLVVDTDHRAGRSDRLEVQGRARLAGTVEVQAATLANRAVTVLTATEGVNLDAGLSVTRTHLFRFELQASPNSLTLQPRAEFALQAAQLGANQQRVASHLQEVWNSGASLGTGFTALAGVKDGDGYARSLNSLSGETMGAIAAFRLSSSRSFVTNMFSECPSFEGAGVTEAEASCAWSRVFGSSTDQRGTGGSLGYRTTAWTLQAGGQQQVAPNLFLGGSLAYEGSGFRGIGGRARVSGDSLLLGVTLRYQQGPLQIAGALDFGYGWYNSRREVEAGTFRATANAMSNVWHVGAHVRTAYTISLPGTSAGWLEGWYVQPRMDLHLTHLRGGGYTETGADPFNLAVDPAGATTFAGTPAVEVGARIRLDERTVLRPFASAGVELIANGDWAATARFAGQSRSSRGFRATAPSPGVLGKFTVGADLLSTANWDFRVHYIAGIGEGYASHSGVGRLAYRF